MSLLRWKDWLEAVGLIAVVVSLLFVGFQLRQDQLIARSELAAEGFNYLAELHGTLLNEQFARTFAKMLDGPEDLSVEEKLQINAFYRKVLTLYIRECYLVERGIYVECEGILRGTVPEYFGNQYAQSWWRLNGQDIAPNFLPGGISTLIEGMDPNASLQFVNNMDSPR